MKKIWEKSKTNWEKVGKKIEKKVEKKLKKVGENEKIIKLAKSKKKHQKKLNKSWKKKLKKAEKKLTHCQRHNGPRVLNPWLELSL